MLAGAGGLLRMPTPQERGTLAFLLSTAAHIADYMYHKTGSENEISTTCVQKGGGCESSG